MKAWKLIIAVFGLLLICGSLSAFDDCLFVRGDWDGDYDVDTTDVTLCAQYLYQSGDDPVGTLDAGDADDDGDIDSSDYTRLYNYVTYGPPFSPPEEPFFDGPCIDGYASPPDNLDHECGTYFLLDYTHNLTKSSTSATSQSSTNLDTFTQQASTASSATMRAEINEALCYADNEDGQGVWKFTQNIGSHDNLYYAEIDGLGRASNCGWAVEWQFDSTYDLRLHDKCSFCPWPLDRNYFQIRGDWEAWLYFTVDSTQYSIKADNPNNRYFELSGSDPTGKHAAPYAYGKPTGDGCACHDPDTPMIYALCPHNEFGSDIFDPDADIFDYNYGIEHDDTYECTSYPETKTYSATAIGSQTVYWTAESIYGAIPAVSHDLDDLIYFDKIVLKDMTVKLEISKDSGGVTWRPMYEDNRVDHTITSTVLRINADSCD